MRGDTNFKGSGSSDPTVYSLYCEYVPLTQLLSLRCHLISKCFVCRRSAGQQSCSFFNTLLHLGIRSGV